MSTDHPGECRCFLTYSGIKLPFNLVTPLAADEVENRNTYLKGYFGPDDRLLGFDKLVYGEVELAHRYAYRSDGTLERVEITDIDGETVALQFDPAGNPA